MNLLKKVAIAIGGFSALFAYAIHNPIPSDVPNWMTAQLITNVFSFNERVASALEFLKYSNRWRGHRLLSDFGSPSMPLKGVELRHVNFAGVDCAVIVPDEFKRRSNPGPAFVHFHGGAFVFSNVNSYLESFADMARKTGFVVMAPEFRRAPEHPFPIPLEDCLNSTIEFVSRAREFNVDPTKVVISGDSAGGNLAVSATLQLLKMKELVDFVPAMTVALCPILQMSNFRLPSYQQNEEKFFTKGILPKVWLSYIGLYHRMELAEVIGINGHVHESVAAKLKINAEWIPDEYKDNFNSTPIPLTSKQALLLDDEVMDYLEKKMLDPRVAPLAASDDELRELPPMYIVAAEYDPLRDDGIILHERLKNLNKKVFFQLYSRTLHPFWILAMFHPNSYYAEQLQIMYDVIKEELK